MTDLPPRLSVSRPKCMAIKCGNNFNEMTLLDRALWWYVLRHWYWFSDTVTENKRKLDATWTIHPYR